MTIETDRFANTSNNNRMYREQIITREDLDQFRTLLLNDLKEMLQSKPEQTKQWLKSNEVRKLLNISPGTLQNLRVNGTITYTKIGGILYYSSADLDKLLDTNKVDATVTLFNPKWLVR
jgi:DNA-binding transcriptional MerR regulator